MVKEIVKTSMFCLGAGFISQTIQHYLGTTFLNEWLKNNTSQLQIALLAINSATLSVTLSKIRDLIDKKNDNNFFKNTRKQMLLSIKEQIALIILTLLAIATWDSPIAKEKIIDFEFTMGVVVFSLFSYSLCILYDTAKSVLLVIDYD
ncbi:hypothetical protein [Alcaligenes faecalis]|uniref:hypothetical protein n=1 Tax=Alcaligenes faecalis TaxID=511 RepID=UPI001C9AB2F4|nr:hypothetical protein [Alcaligenes faecalis]MBY6309953.1 hypothetical protein [Alcaligenes faecalis]MBY6315923.1 hypothetical protein [Alcaligenes faecalis]MBY6390870.1 hypothetical protein [Alcaligenes faecalis]